MSTNKNEHVDTLNAFATEVAVALSDLTGKTWRVSRPANNDYPAAAHIAAGEQSLDLHLPMYGSDGKVNVTGDYADEAPGRSRVYLHPETAGFKDRDRPSINVSASRSPKAVAGDINRRLLPAYEAVRARIVELVHAEQDAASSKADALASMAKALGVPTPKKYREWDSEPDDVRSPVNGNAGYGDFRANHNGTSWNIELRSVPTSVAEEIARIISANRGS